MSSLDEARRAIKTWLKPPPSPTPEDSLSPPSSRSLFRSSSVTSRAETVASSSTPARTNSLSALATLDAGRSTPSILAPKLKPLEASNTSQTTPSLPPPKPKALAIATPPSAPFSIKPPTVIITSPTSGKRISFPAVRSPTNATSATNTESVQPSLTPASPSRHGVSGGRFGGRFSISGVLGYSRPTSMGGAMSNLSRLAEDYPAARPLDTRLKASPVRVRVESSPLLSRKSSGKAEDWSSRAWKMGEGPGAAETLGEFGEGVKRKGSGELLSMTTSSGLKQPIGRARAGSLGRDSRLYGNPPSDEGNSQWGIEVEGIRIGECSALTGEGESSSPCPWRL